MTIVARTMEVAAQNGESLICSSSKLRFDLFVVESVGKSQIQASAEISKEAVQTKSSGDGFVDCI